MDYQVWTKDVYGELWMRRDAGDKGAAKRLILEELKEGREPTLTIEVPFDLQLNVGEPGGEIRKQRFEKAPPAEKTAKGEVKSEAHRDQTEPDKNTRG